MKLATLQKHCGKTDTLINVVFEIEWRQQWILLLWVAFCKVAAVLTPSAFFLKKIWKTMIAMQVKYAWVTTDKNVYPLWRFLHSHCCLMFSYVPYVLCCKHLTLVYEELLCTNKSVWPVLKSLLITQALNSGLKWLMQVKAQTRQKYLSYLNVSGKFSVFYSC